MITIETVKKNEELEAILELQAKNLPQNLSETEKLSEGFVTVYHTFSLLKKMNTCQAHFIAKDDKQIVGYALCMPPKFQNDIEILKPMFREINGVFRTSISLSKVKSYIVMGQICIAKTHRGQGLFRKLYRAMQTELKFKYDAIITEVDVKNKRSLLAHYAVGFEDMSTYTSGGQQWKLIILYT